MMNENKNEEIKVDTKRNADTFNEKYATLFAIAQTQHRIVVNQYGQVVCA